MMKAPTHPPIQSLTLRCFGFFHTFPVISKDGKLLQYSGYESACICLYYIHTIFTTFSDLTTLVAKHIAESLMWTLLNSLVVSSGPNSTRVQHLGLQNL